VDIPVESHRSRPRAEADEPEAQRWRRTRLGSETGREGGDPSGHGERHPMTAEYGGQSSAVSADGIPNGTGAGPVADYDAPPRIVRQTRPLYPPQAFVDKVEGTVVLEILIDVSGHVSRTRVIQSIPPLDTAARDAVGEWVFQPAFEARPAVPSLALARFTFDSTAPPAHSSPDSSVRMNKAATPSGRSCGSNPADRQLSRNTIVIVILASTGLPFSRIGS
jgi:TonB family protein